jgi:hypothetical protein
MGTGLDPQLACEALGWDGGTGGHSIPGRREPRKVLETLIIIVYKCLYDCATTGQAMSSDVSGPDRPSRSGPRRARLGGLDARGG